MDNCAFCGEPLIDELGAMLAAPEGDEVFVDIAAYQVCEITVHSYEGEMRGNLLSGRCAQCGLGIVIH